MVTTALKTVLTLDLLLFTDGQTSGFVQSCPHNLYTVFRKILNKGILRFRIMCVN